METVRFTLSSAILDYADFLAECLAAAAAFAASRGWDQFDWSFYYKEGDRAAIDVSEVIA